MSWCVLHELTTGEHRIIGPMTEWKADEIVKFINKKGGFGAVKKRMIEPEDFVTQLRRLPDGST